MSVRAALPGDAPAIAEIWNRYIRETAVTFTTAEKTVEGLAADIAARAAPMGFFVAEDAGRVLGFATSFAFRSGPGYARSLEHSILLAPGAGGRGLGRALMAALEDRAREGGAHVLVAGISGENAGAVAFHAALGFEKVGEMPEVGHKFGRYMPLVLMQKFL
jgi:L-amino acid N-acyltransferase YncA